MYFSINQTPTDETTIANQVRSFLFFVKTALVANGWVVKSSSTGSSYNGSGDNWTAYTDISAGALAWCCLESPASIITGGSGKVWIVLGYNSGGTAYNAYMTAHRELPTGGATNLMPTTATVLTVLNNGALFATSLASCKFHITMWPTGAFWAGASLTSNANINTCIQVMPVTDIIGSFPYAIAFKASYASASWPQTHFDNMKSWNSDGSVTSNGAFCTAEARLQSSFTLLGATITTAGNLAGNQEASKIYVNISGQGKIGTLGGSTYDFLACGSTALANGTTDAATPKHTFNNNIFWPSNAAII